MEQTSQKQQQPQQPKHEEERTDSLYPGLEHHYDHGDSGEIKKPHHQFYSHHYHSRDEPKKPRKVVDVEEAEPELATDFRSVDNDYEQSWGSE